MNSRRDSSLFLIISCFLLFHTFVLTENTRSYNFVLTRARYSRLCSSKNILTINGRFPGPTIYAARGDVVTVNVHNKADENVTLHWHGFAQQRNPWSDGPNYITQCPIQPGASFRYKIIIAEEEGTLWWHAHSDWTRATVYGAFFIYPRPGTTYPFPKPYKDFPIILGQWWKKDVRVVEEEFLRLGGGPEVSDAHTTNGQPGDLYPCSQQGTSRIVVSKGKTYHLRIINAGMNTEYFLSVAQHQLTIVGTDGSYLKPLNVDYIMISPGQTIDVLLEANQSPGQQYYMAARPFASSTDQEIDSTTTAIIHYNDSNSNTSLPPILPYMPDHNDTNAADSFVFRFRSLANKDHPINVPLTVDTHLLITVSINTLPCNTCQGRNGTRLSASLNNISFVSPSIDILSAYYKMIDRVYERDFPNKPPFIFNFTADFFPPNVFTPQPGTKVKVLKYNSFVEIVLQGTNLVVPGNHPIHLHGYSFYVVGYGFGNFHKSDRLKYNLVDPPLVNTVSVPKSGWASIRFRANNPGVWFMHCHLERHLSWGMNTVFIVKNGVKVNHQMLPPPNYRPPC